MFAVTLLQLFGVVWTQLFLVFDDPYHSLAAFSLYSSSLMKISENHLYCSDRE